MSDTAGNSLDAPISINVDNGHGVETYTEGSLSNPESPAAATQEIADIATEEAKPVDTTDQLTKAQNAARESTGYFAEIAKSLLNSGDKDTLQQIFSEKPHLERAIKTRYPEEFNKIFGHEETQTTTEDNPLRRLTSVAERELNMERLLEAKLFQRDHGIADDEMKEITSVANSLLDTDPSLTLTKAYQLATSVSRPTSTRPKSRANTDHISSGSYEDPTENDGLGFTGQAAQTAKDLRKEGMQVVNEFGNLVIRYNR